jgi:hypothetical protein
VIDKALAEFLEGGVAIHLGTRNDLLEPTGARATAVKVDDDGVHVLVYVPTVAARRVLPDLESNGHAALVFARPVDDRACQLKGRFVSARQARRDERAVIDAQWKRFLDNLAHIGIPASLQERWARWPSLAIHLRATALFTQTPGPDAGAPLS